MTTTYDLGDIKARLLAVDLPYDARMDVLHLIAFVGEVRDGLVRHYHAMEEISDALAEANLPAWANQLLDEAGNIFSDLYPADPHEDCLATLRPCSPCIPAQRREASHA